MFVLIIGFTYNSHLHQTHQACLLDREACPALHQPQCSVAAHAPGETRIQASYIDHWKDQHWGFREAWGDLVEEEGRWSSECEQWSPDGSCARLGEARRTTWWWLRVTASVCNAVEQNWSLKCGTAVWESLVDGRVKWGYDCSVVQLCTGWLVDDTSREKSCSHHHYSRSYTRIVIHHHHHHHQQISRFGVEEKYVVKLTKDYYEDFDDLIH